MPDKLIIRLRNNTDATTTIEWLLWDPLDKSPINQGQGIGEELFNIAQQVQDIFVLVPGVDVLLTDVKLPKMSASQRLKAIPFALEEQITEDPALLHFAAGHALKGEPLPVAVINKEKLSHWQNLLKEHLKDAYLKVSAFMPDTLAIPFKEEMYSILIDGNQVIVRCGKEAGFVTEKEDLIPVLQLMLNRARTKPTVINMYDPDHTLSEEVKKLEIPVNVLPERVNTLELMAQNLDGQKQVLNLLQGVYAQPKNKINLQQLVKFSFALAGSWLILLTLASIVNLSILMREESVIAKKIQAIYAKLYPSKPLPENPKTSIQKELAQLESSRIDSKFMRIVKLLAPAASPIMAGGSMLKTATFKNNQLILEVETKDLALIDQLRQALEQRGLKVVVSNAQRETGGTIATRLTIEESS